MTRSLILVCTSCHEFTLRELCPRCGAATLNPLPPKYSPEDPYGEYRRRLKRLARAEAKGG